MHNKLSPFQKEIVAGLTAGSITSLVVHPLDLIKLRLQLLATNSTNVNNYKLVLKTLLVNDKRGTSVQLQRLYRGFTINFLGNSLAWGLYFGFYRYSKDMLLEANMINNKSMVYLIAGAASGITTSILTNPIWVIKTRIMSTNKNSVNSYNSTIAGFKSLIKHEGYKGLWKGLTPAIFGVSQGAMYFMIYDTIKSRLLSRENDKLSNLQTISMTSLSKMLSVSAVYPFQLLKSNLQSFKAANENYSIFRLISLIYYTKGFKGLYSGLSANLLKAVPSTCVTFCIYENLNYYLREDV